jgi:hypothetical protein
MWQSTCSPQSLKYLLTFYRKYLLTPGVNYRMNSLKLSIQPGVVVHISNTNTEEAEAGESQVFESHLGCIMKPCVKNKQNLQCKHHHPIQKMTKDFNIGG